MLWRFTEVSGQLNALDALPPPLENNSGAH